MFCSSLYGLFLKSNIESKHFQRHRLSTSSRWCKDQLIKAAQAAEHISNDSVTLPSDPAQPALVTSQQDSSTRYNVSGSCTDQPSCSCAMGSQGAVCKYIVKVINLQTGRSLYDIVLSLGTLGAGSCKGGMDKLLDPSKPDQVSNSWADTAAALIVKRSLNSSGLRAAAHCVTMAALLALQLQTKMMTALSLPTSTSCQLIAKATPR